MKGKVEVYEIHKGSHYKVYEDLNMVVDGAKETIVDLLTFQPAPSAVSSTALNSVSSFQIQAFTLAGPDSSFLEHDSRRTISYDHASGTQYLHVTGTGSGVHGLRAFHNGTFNKYGTSRHHITHEPKEELIEYLNVRSQPSYDSLIREILPIDFKLNKFGDPQVLTSVTAISVITTDGRDYVDIEVETPTYIGSQYEFEIYGDSTVPVEVAYLVRNSTEGGSKYYHNTSHKFKIGESFYEKEFKNGRIKFNISPDYTSRDEYSIGLGGELRHFLVIRVPRANLYEIGKATVTLVKVFPQDAFILQNPFFNRVNNWLRNSDFSVGTIRSNISPEVAHIYSLSSFDGWKIQDGFNENYDISSVGVVSGIGSSGIGLQASSLTGSGAARISQTVFVTRTSLDPLVVETDVSPYRALGVLSFDVTSKTTGASGCLVSLKDITAEEYYSFDGTWGPDVPKVVGSGTIGGIRRYSEFIPLHNRLTHAFELTIKGRGTATGMASYEFYRVKFGTLEGWTFGNSISSDIMSLQDHEYGPGMIMSGTPTSVSGAHWENVAYVGQSFVGLDPQKAYQIAIDSEKLKSGEATRIGFSIFHREYGNISDYKKYDLAKNIGYLSLESQSIASKVADIGYAYYLNPVTSPSAVQSPHGIDVNTDKYKLTDRAVSFDGAFQGTTNRRLFLPCNPGTQELSLRTTKITDSELYYLGLRARLDNGVEHWYNFTTKVWTSIQGTGRYVNGTYVSAVVDTDSNYRINVSGNTAVSFKVPSFGTAQEIVNVCLEFRSDISGTVSPTLTDPLYINTIECRGSQPRYKGKHTTPPKNFYYSKNGTWTQAPAIVPVSAIGHSTIIADSVFEETISNDERQQALPVFGVSALGTYVDSNLGTVTLGATENSTYDIFIYHVSGTGLHVNKIALTDIGLTVYEGALNIRDRNLRTSERFYNRIPFYDEGWHIHNASGGGGGTWPLLIPTDFQNNYDGFGFSVDTSLTASPVVLCYTTTAKDLRLSNGKLKASFDHFGSNYNIRTSVLAKRADKDTEFFWNWTTGKWDNYKDTNYVALETGVLEGTFTFSASDYPLRNFLTSAVYAVDNFADDDKVMFAFRLDQTTGGTAAWCLFTNARAYNFITTTEASANFPLFPNPIDTSVQPISDGPGRFGHFLNHMQYYLRGIDIHDTRENASFDGCYSEGSGTTLWSGAAFVSSYGVLNQYGVITPNGYILEQNRIARGSEVILDSSAGFVMSGISPVSSTNQIAYSLTLTADEWKVLNDHYGGIGGLGLHTIDYENTAKKLGSEEGVGGPPFLPYGRNTASAVTLGTAGTAPTRNDSPAETFRVTQYAIFDGEWPDSQATYNLTLNNDLSPNYFVILETVGARTGSGQPRRHWARVAGDPFGTGDLATTTSANNILNFERNAGAPLLSHLFTVTVVECLADSSNSGFKLKHIFNKSKQGAEDIWTGSTAWIMPTSANWTDINKVVPYVQREPATGNPERKCSYSFTAWPQVSGSSQVLGWQSVGDIGQGTEVTDYTVFVVEWGSEWTIQDIQYQTASSVGGSNQSILDTIGYTTIPLNSNVISENTWLYGDGAVSSSFSEDTWESHIYTLGDGSSVPTNASTIAVGNVKAGLEVNAHIYTHTHPAISITHTSAMINDGTITLDKLWDIGTLPTALGEETITASTFVNPSGIIVTEGSRFSWITYSIMGWLDASGTASMTPHHAMSFFSGTDLYSYRWDFDSTEYVTSATNTGELHGWYQIVDFYPASQNTEPLNGDVLFAESKTKTGRALFHTTFGKPVGRQNNQGWANAGSEYVLTLLYKGQGNNLKLRSDNFDDISLSGDGRWYTLSSTFSAIDEGYNIIRFQLRDEGDPADNKTPELMLGSALLYDNTAASTVGSYQFNSLYDLEDFNTDWAFSNEVEHLRLSFDGSFYTTSLYKSSDLAHKEPEFKLFAKKAFFPGGLQINPSSNYITIVWTISF